MSSTRLSTIFRNYSSEEILENIEFEDLAKYIAENYPGGLDEFHTDFKEDYGE